MQMLVIRQYHNGYLNNGLANRNKKKVKKVVEKNVDFHNKTIDFSTTFFLPFFYKNRLLFEKQKQIYKMSIFSYNMSLYYRHMK